VRTRTAHGGATGTAVPSAAGLVDVMGAEVLHADGRVPLDISDYGFADSGTTDGDLHPEIVEASFILNLVDADSRMDLNVHSTKYSTSLSTADPGSEFLKAMNEQRHDC